MTRLAIACAFALLGFLAMLIYLITERPKKAAPTLDCPYRHDSRCPRVEDEG